VRHAWIIYGSDMGSPRQPNRIHAADDVLERWAVETMGKERLAVDTKVPHDAKARGEAGTIQRLGGRYFTVVCGSDVYHSPADRWPDAVDVSLLARYAKAFANGALKLANLVCRHSGGARTRGVVQAGPPAFLAVGRTLAR
jgi:hypothetical protein